MTINVLGIPVIFHWSLLPWVTFFFLVAGDTLLLRLAGLVVLLTLYAALLTHEFAHVLVARLLGYHTWQIVFTPLGAAAFMEDFHRRPRHELLIAVAGPAVNLFFAFMAATWILITRHALIIHDLPGDMPGFFLLGNCGIAAFNLIPAFPLDGGRIFRASATMFISFNQASELARRLAICLSSIMTALGLFYNPIVMAIGAFILLTNLTPQANGE